MLGAIPSAARAARRALAEHGEGDIARVNIGKLANLRCNPGASLALLRWRAAGVPHEIISDKHRAALKGIQQRHRSTLADEPREAIHLDHGEPSADGRDRIAFSGVGLLSNPQCVQLNLEGAPIDYLRGSKLTPHEFFHRTRR